MIGKTLSHFRIVSKIGEGGMGVVYRAEDENLKRPVALKVLPPDLIGNEERRMRFVREARAAAAVTHPSIATVYEVGEAGGQVFIAMELVEGKALSALIGGRPLPMRDALRIGVEIAEGLARAHKALIIHRDLKPDNVIVGEDGHAKILDFGLAKLLERERRGGQVPGERAGPVGGGAGDAGRTVRGAETRGGAAVDGGPAAGDDDLSRLNTISGEMTREGRILGTAAYMSPEQARGQPVDARSDIFSLGSTLYEMVTGRVPFRGKTAIDTLSAIIREPVRPAAEMNPEVPADLERILAKALEKAPEERYQDARDLLVDLRKLKRVTDSGVQVAQVTRRSHARRYWSVPSVVRLVLGLAVVIGILLWLNVGGWRHRLERDSTGGGAGTGAGAVKIKSLAVLPLDNLSGDPEQEYFSDGMTEALIASLAQIRALRVISRTSAMQYKGAKKPLPEIGRELGVDAVVEGSVMRSGDRVRITAQLVEAATDRHLWAQSYDRDIRDVLALQGEVARDIASKIEVELTPQEAALLANARPVDPEAHEHYLAARHLMARRTAQGLTRAIEEFGRAIEKDPGYAPAHAGLAYIYAILPFYRVTPVGESHPKGRVAALRALELGPGLSEAHMALGFIKIFLERDWVGGGAEFRKAIELSPNDPTGHMNYGSYLSWLGREGEALAEYQKARNLDPLSSIIALNLVSFYHNFRHFDAALAEVQRLIELHPGFGPARDQIGSVYVDLGRYEEGIATLRQRLGSADAQIPKVMADLVRACALAGKMAEARSLIAELVRLSERSYVPPGEVAFAYASLGDLDPAFHWLDRSVREGPVELRYLKIGLRWDPLRADPRFAELLRRVGIPED
jgi:serine/threonine-protein kinase